MKKHEPVFALIDCNSFYASCERVFRPDLQKTPNGVLVDLPYPTDDVRLITKAAVEAVERVCRPGFKYSKAEVLQLNLYQKGEYTEDLFSNTTRGLSWQRLGRLTEVSSVTRPGTFKKPLVPNK